MIYIWTYLAIGAAVLLFYGKHGVKKIDLSIREGKLPREYRAFVFMLMCALTIITGPIWLIFKLFERKPL